MNLPKKDKNGNSYLSYSQISLFKRDKDEYYQNYIIGKKFEGNEYTDFGSKVGEALEKNDFTSFSEQESNILKQVTRLDEFERRVILKYEGFYIVGYVDTNKKDLTRIIDYKTGGLKKEWQYVKPEYTQLHIYALSIRQETGITPTKASVEFIRRTGNAYKGQKLKVANESPTTIEVDVSINKLKRVYWETLETAKQIEKFYKKTL
jgi:hypothetical protein